MIRAISSSAAAMMWMRPIPHCAVLHSIPPPEPKAHGSTARTRRNPPPSDVEIGTIRDHSQVDISLKDILDSTLLYNSTIFMII